MTHEFSSHDSWLARQRHGVARAVPALFGRRAASPSDEDLRRGLDGLLEEARGAASEAGAWDLPDDFLESIEPSLNRVVRTRPEMFDVAPAMMAAQLAAVQQELHRLEPDLSVRTLQTPSRLPRGIGIGRVATVVAGMLVVVAGLGLRGVPATTSGRIAVAALVGVGAAVEAASRWARGAPQRRRARRQRRLQAEAAWLSVEIRRSERSSARLDRWIAGARRLVEAEYRRYRARAARAMEPSRKSTMPRALEVRHGELSGVIHSAHG